MGKTLGKRLPVADRLLAAISREPSGCWLWQGTKDPQGYGQISIKDKTSLAHRVAYQAFVGDVPIGLQLDHLCRNRACINPEHLEPVTPRENSVVRAIGSVGEINAKKTTCRFGHGFTDVIVRRGTKCKPRRWCVTCRGEASARYRTKRAQERRAS